MTIGQVAKEGGLRASAIRFYEKSGLLPKAVRSGGQRRYDRSILERLAVLERAKDCGFTLDEIRMLFHGFRGDVPLSKRWHDLAAKKIAELDALAARIAVMKELLERARKCQCLDAQECGRRILEGAKKREGR
ncbi:MAG TPA: MerR family transcriptional regulator [Bryobacteraceae bacterium]|nr:MerR family transcriptional regulator [Bryobacteraceae bacterium]